MARKPIDPIAYLTGRLSGQPRPSGISLPGGDGKFYTDGSVQPWPGNTFICHLDPASASFAAIRELQESIKRSEFNGFFTFLPPSSFHMTIFQGISPETRPGYDWPDDVDWPQGRDEVSAELLRRIDGVALPLTRRVRPVDLFAAHLLAVTGADAAEEAALRAARHALRDATRIPQEGFDDYVFHISLAYVVDWVSEPLAREIVAFSTAQIDRYRDAIGEIALGPIEFCHFETMHHFAPIKILR